MTKLITIIFLSILICSCSQKQENPPSDLSTDAIIDAALDSIIAPEKAISELTFDQKVRKFIEKLKKHTGKWRVSFTGDLTAFRTEVDNIDITVNYFSDDNSMWLQIDDIPIYKGEANIELIRILVRRVGGSKRIKAETLLNKILE